MTRTIGFSPFNDFSLTTGHRIGGDIPLLGRVQTPDHRLGHRGVHHDHRAEDEHRKADGEEGHTEPDRFAQTRADDQADRRWKPCSQALHPTRAETDLMLASQNLERLQA